MRRAAGSRQPSTVRRARKTRSEQASPDTCARSYRPDHHSDLGKRRSGIEHPEHRQSEHDRQNSPPWTFFCRPHRPCSDRHHGPGSIQSSPSGIRPARMAPAPRTAFAFSCCIVVAISDDALGGRSCVKESSSAARPLDSSGGEYALRQNEQQQQYREEGEEKIKGQPGRLSENLLFPALETRAFCQLPPGKSSQAP